MPALNPPESWSHRRPHHPRPLRAIISSTYLALADPSFPPHLTRIAKTSSLSPNLCARFHSSWLVTLTVFRRAARRSLTPALAAQKQLSRPEQPLLPRASRLAPPTPTTRGHLPKAPLPPRATSPLPKRPSAVADLICHPTNAPYRTHPSDLPGPAPDSPLQH